MLELTAEIEGREVEAVTKDYQSAESGLTNGSISADETSILQEWIEVRVKGSTPAGVHIADRYTGDGLQWAYALAERPGATRKIDLQYRRGLSRVKKRALIPGLAQFEKNEPRRAWIILSAEAAGLIGWGTLSLLSSDLKDRRDRARRVSSYNHYDKWANRTGWGSLAMATLAIGMYGYSVLDGFLAVPTKHQLLLGADMETLWTVVSFKVP